MQEVNSLAAKLKEHLPWHQARILCIAQFILSLLQARTANLCKLAEYFDSPALAESSYRRIKRLFAWKGFCLHTLNQLTLSWLPIESYTLCMDRTNWKYGTKAVNYLMVSIVWQGASIPIAWMCMDKRGGNSNTKERIALMQKVLSILPAKKIDRLLADREFIGKDWFEWLKSKDILFRCRIRNDTLVMTTQGRWVKVSRLFRHIKSGQVEIWGSRRKVFDVKLYLAATRSAKSGELMVVAGLEKPDSLLSDYAKRWAIEVLFSNLKSRGFDLEATHMTAPEKMDRLMGLLSLTVLWCLVIGQWEHGDAEQLPLNRHYRPQKSLFRLGMDRLRRVLLNSCAKHDSISFKNLIDVLSPT